MAKESVALQGRWEVVSAEEEGKQTTAIYRPGTAWVTIIVIEVDELYFTDGFTRSDPTKFKLDKKTKPKSIDSRDEKRKQEMKGIYALDKDSLKLCMSREGERPKEFKTKAGDNTTLFVLKLQKP